MTDPTPVLTDAKLAEIEADLHNRPLIVLEVDVTALIAALRESRTRERQYEAAIRDALAPLGRGGPCRTCKCEGCEAEREMAVEILRAALGEERP